MIAKDRNRRLLLVDDEEEILDLLNRQLRSEGYDISLAPSGESGLQIVQDHEVGVIVSDQSMPGMDGITFLDKVREINDEVVFIMLTGDGSLESVLKAVNQLQIFSYIIKPWSVPSLQSTIRNAFQHYEACSIFRKTVKRWMYQNEHLKRENDKLTKKNKEIEMQLEKIRGTMS